MVICNSLRWMMMSISNWHERGLLDVIGPVLRFRLIQATFAEELTTKVSWALRRSLATLEMTEKLNLKHQSQKFSKS